MLRPFAPLAEKRVAKCWERWRPWAALAAARTPAPERELERLRLLQRERIALALVFRVSWPMLRKRRLDDPRMAPKYWAVKLVTTRKQHTRIYTPAAKRRIMEEYYAYSI